MIEMIENEILDNKGHASWDDIAGLEFAKKCVQEIVVWPMLRQGRPLIACYVFATSLRCRLLFILCFHERICLV